MTSLPVSRYSSFWNSGGVSSRSFIAKTFWMRENRYYYYTT